MAPGVGFAEALANAMRGEEANAPAATSSLAVAVIAQSACEETYRLQSVLAEAQRLLRDRTLLRHTLCASFYSGLRDYSCCPRSLMALWTFQGAGICSLDEALKVSGVPELLGSALPDLLAGNCKDPGVAATAAVAATNPAAEGNMQKEAFKAILCHLVLAVYLGEGANRTAGKAALESLRLRWLDWQDQPQKLTVLTDCWAAAAAGVKPASCSREYILNELQQLLLSESAGGGFQAEGWPSKLVYSEPLDQAMRVAITHAGLRPVIGVVRASITTKDRLQWAVVFSLVRQVMQEEDDASLDDFHAMVKHIVAQCGETCSERLITAALMLSRAMHSLPHGGRTATGPTPGSYGIWFGKLVKGEAPDGRASGLKDSSRAMQIMLKLLSALVPTDSLEVLEAQRAVLGGLPGQASEQLRDYQMLALARINELKETSGAREGCVNQGQQDKKVSAKDRAEAARQTEEFAKNGFRISQAFVNLARNWKKDWFNQRLVPALMEPVLVSGAPRESRLRFLEALAAKRLIPNSAPEKFERLCDVALLSVGQTTIPPDAPLEVLCMALPRVLAKDSPSRASSALQQLASRIRQDLKEEGSGGQFPSIVEALLQLPAAALGHGGAGIARWHVDLVAIISHEPSLHAPFWRRLSELCRCHLQELTSYQVYAVASLLVAASVTTSSDASAVVPGDVQGGHQALFLFPSCSELLESDAADGPALAAAVLDQAVSGSLVQTGQGKEGLLAAAGRLCSAVAVLGIGLNNRVSLKDWQRCREDTASLDVKAKRQRRELSCDAGQCSMTDLVPVVPPLAVHFLSWSVDVSRWHNSFREEATAGTRAVEPDLLAAERLLQSPTGQRLLEAAGPVPLSTLMYLEAAAELGEPRDHPRRHAMAVMQGGLICSADELEHAGRESAPVDVREARHVAEASAAALHRLCATSALPEAASGLLPFVSAAMPSFKPSPQQLAAGSTQRPCLWECVFVARLLAEAARMTGELQGHPLGRMSLSLALSVLVLSCTRALRHGPAGACRADSAKQQLIESAERLRQGLAEAAAGIHAHCRPGRPLADYYSCESGTGAEEQAIVETLQVTLLQIIEA